MTDNVTRACAMCGKKFDQFASRYPRLRCYACDPGPKIATGDRLEHGTRDGDDGMWGNEDGYYDGNRGCPRSWERE